MATFDQKIVEFLNNWTVGADNWPIGNLILCIIALVLTTVLVGVVGIEREKRGRSAGLRTHLLVGVGSCILMIISIYGFPTVFADKRDVARLAAQVITGVGFLGAGAIIHRNDGIKGLTTAGTIWVSMAIGIGCGSFNFILSLLGTGLIVAVLTVFKKIEVRVNRGTPTIVVNAPMEEPVLGKILEVSKRFNCTVHSVSSDSVEDECERRISVTYQAAFSKNEEERLMDYISELQKEIKSSSIHLLSHH